MAWTLIATVGGSTSNAYDTAANADIYFATHPLWKRWDVLYTAEKERLLILATRQIDYLPIAGDPLTSGTTAGIPNQALRFPRAVDNDASGAFIPAIVKKAMFEQAVFLSERGGTTSKRRSLQLDGVKSITVDDVTEVYDLSSSGASHELCPRAYQMLSEAGLLCQSAGWAS